MRCVSPDACYEVKVTMESADSDVTTGADPGTPLQAPVGNANAVESLTLLVPSKSFTEPIPVEYRCRL
jgi:hypothetical protein